MAGPWLGSGSPLRNPAAPLTGLFGGSFNPAHGGHRRVTLFALQALRLDEVWWLVSPGNVLKPVEGMAPLAARLASARRQSRNAPIRATAIERELGTRFTVDTLRAIKRRYPKRRFVWLMGADNLAQFHRWKHWRQIASEMPIAVIARPGYDSAALASPAMAWLRRWRQRPGRFVSGAMRSAPALTILRFDPDHRSASAIRAHDPDWSRRYAPAAMRDAVTHCLVGRGKP
ncbi:nicotinate-nucleotide adenylyltransferase [Novosphingobium jiangmenense]|uniref:Probable nicotinate-nucleotide adenylyltransferase n=1 Tax=Novosphingobium jiangmenense TaxID=2791981 RepID=A0ABS0HGD0_9SPHN|nr:nicotinate-nucleotide adenylyltransferase [Novosphingobium jiangmenense]